VGKKRRITAGEAGENGSPILGLRRLFFNSLLRVPAVGDHLFYNGKRPGPGQGVGIPGPAENLDGDIGTDGGAQRTADALLRFPDGGAEIAVFTLLPVKAQQFPLASGRAEAAALAPFCVNFDPGNHSLVLKELFIGQPAPDCNNCSRPEELSAQSAGGNAATRRTGTVGGKTGLDYNHITRKVNIHPPD
jgi:hypothetical protein